jgi:hypothetical protein
VRGPAGEGARSGAPWRVLWTAACLALACLSVRCTLFVDSSGLADGPATDGAASELDTPTSDAGSVDGQDADAPARPFPGASVWEGNGHQYVVVVRSSGITWPEAKAEAESFGGHLVTLNSAAENDFVFGLIHELDEVWKGENGPFIGAERAPPTDGAPTSPDVGWRWVTGEPWTYTKWSPGEPNNDRGDEDIASYVNEDEETPRTNAWNDRARTDSHRGYVLELE